MCVHVHAAGEAFNRELINVSAMMTEADRAFTGVHYCSSIEIPEHSNEYRLILKPVTTTFIIKYTNYMARVYI